jgi:hypothetical protein
VRVIDAASAATSSTEPAVEVVETERGIDYVLVRSNKTLKQLPWLRLVEVTPSRYLLALPSGMAVESLEVGIIDLLDKLAPEEEYERNMLLRLRELFKHQRLGRSVSRAEILFIKTREKGSHR